MKLRWPWRKREKGWTCTRVQQYWDEYTEDKLSVRDKFEYEAHLATCEECQDFVHFLKYENAAVAGAVRAAARARVAGKPIPQKIIGLAERLSPEDKLRLIQFAQRSEETERRREEDERLREEKRRRREMEREKAERAKPN
jgi:Putative zinc-finger